MRTHHIPSLATWLILPGLLCAGRAHAQPASSPLPYPPRAPSVPQAPAVISTPSTWPNAEKATPAPIQAEQILSDEDMLAPWLKPKGGVPDTFDGTEVVARVGTEVVLASDINMGVEETVERALKAGKISPSQEAELRHYLMRQRLEQLIDTKVLLIEARREIPKENMPKIEQKVREIFDKEHLPKMIDGEKIKSRAELFKAMKAAGTSIEEQRRLFLERSLAAQYVHKKVGDDKEITHEEMLRYYHEHLSDYETAPRAKWEHLMVRFSNYKTKEEAWSKLAEWGNLILQGTSLSDVARKHSDDLSSEAGGLHDWTTQGALASQTLDDALFSLPVHQLSPILEDERGFHIVRVVERHGLERTPFGEVQAEIKKKIKADREGVATKECIATLRKEIAIWTIFDDIQEIARDPDAPPLQ
jgi:hypothetical protein